MNGNYDNLFHIHSFSLKTITIYRNKADELNLFNPAFPIHYTFFPFQ